MKNRFDQFRVVFRLVELVQAKLCAMLAYEDAELPGAICCNSSFLDCADTSTHELLHVRGKQIVGNSTVTLSVTECARNGSEGWALATPKKFVEESHVRVPCCTIQPKQSMPESGASLRFHSRFHHLLCKTPFVSRFPYRVWKRETKRANP
ncbi:MAG TPA: hypothetical protein VG733_10110, partial [Chthoniobacteraceae bacterium]|nr:hypothetical protein [Chthoniobacteraceae bacterium]